MVFNTSYAIKCVYICTCVKQKCDSALFNVSYELAFNYKTQSKTKQKEVFIRF